MNTKTSMEKILFKKIELWLVGLIFLISFLFVLYWVYQIVVHKAYPYKEISEIDAFFEAGERAGFNKRTIKEELEEKLLKVNNRQLRTRSDIAENALNSQMAPGKFPESVGDACLVAATSDNGILSIMMFKDHDIIHKWDVGYDRIFGTKEQNGKNRINGLVVLPDGSVVVNFEKRKGLARIDRKGQPMWVREDTQTHHSVTLTANNTLWVPVDVRFRKKQGLHAAGNRVVYLQELDIDTGETIRSINLTDILEQNSLHGHYALAERDDVLHVNDVQEVGSAFAAANAALGIKPNDIIVNAKYINLVIIFSPDTGKASYAEFAPWNQPHDTDPQNDGTFLLFDNNLRPKKSEFEGNSRILSVSLDDKSVEVLFTADWFYSATQSDQERFGENILVTSDNSGLVFNVYDGEVNFWMTRPYDDKRHWFLEDAQWIDPDFFDDEKMRKTCSGA